MADDEIQDVPTTVEAADTPTDTPTEAPAEAAAEAKPAKKAAAKKAAKKAPAKRATKKAAAAPEVAPDAAPDPAPDAAAEAASEAPAEAPAEAKPAKKAAAKKTTKKAATKKTAVKKTASAKNTPAEPAEVAAAAVEADPVAAPVEQADTPAETGPGTMPLFQVPETPAKAPAKRTRSRKKVEPAPVEETADVEAVEADAPTIEAAAPPEVDPVTDDATDPGDPGDPADPAEDEQAEADTDAPADAEDQDGADDEDESDDDNDDDTDDAEGDSGPRRRRRRGGRRRRRGGGSGDAEGSEKAEKSDDGDDASREKSGDKSGERSGERSGRSEKPAKGESSEKGDAEGSDDTQKSDDGESGEGGSSSRRRRRRRREGDGGDGGGDDPANTTTRVRKARSPEDEITSVQGSTRLEAKKQRRREGREAGRRRAPIVSEAEFLARREAVDRVMVVRQRDELTQIGVIEDKVLVEHYVARESQTSLIGNIYLGRVQNVLPSMEAAFIDIGKGRNAVLYAGEVNWSSLGHKDGSPRKIESVLSSGQTVLVQVTKDPIGHKGARLTSQISLAGRFLVYVPDGTTSGISRKLPDTERHRLKTLLKEIVPDTAGVIVRTAAEGASEDELTRDVERLKARWEDIEAKTKGRGGNPQLLYGEPDLTLKVVRDLFTEDFGRLVIQGDDAWDLVHGYVEHMAPDLLDRVEKYDVAEHDGVDVFAAHRIDEQIAKALDRKVFLPSGGSLIIDRTEAMTVVDVNTGKFTGSGGNLEETVTKNNLEAAEEVVRQLRLRDIGGIIVVDFIDMVLESNRDLVLRRLVECLGRDRTRHQVAEVTSLGLVQMTRKRIGTGLLEAFSENCEHCQGRGLVLHDMPIEPKRGGGGGGSNGNGGGSNGGGSNGGGSNGGGAASDDQGGERRSGRRRGGRGGRGGDDQGQQGGGGRDAKDAGAGGRDARDPAKDVPAQKPSPAEFAAMAKAEVHKDDEAPEAPVTELVDGAAPVPEPVSEPVPQLATEPEPAAEPEPAPVAVEPEQPVAPEPPAEPKVVTRARRGVSRTVTTTAPVAPVEVTTAPAPVAAPAAPVEPPKVVTRTRRGASRRTTTAAPDGATEATEATED
ncbi:Rne/Rng family ribonuclease [Nocardioides litoris]|uniref:Rne/Rng family ribonuclease n=1 Tax=Nocardioides litoris TaxID=1926648 RepID=UPI00112069FA|nr:Rne/Rng family ribonuclease [Nocardioides litoris]